MRFEVVVDDLVVGWTELESGDPPMGIALGRMHPNAAYAGVKPGSSFRVRVAGGEFLEPCGGVDVADYSAEVGADAIEITVFGLNEGLYRKYFAAHVQAYDDHWAARRS